MFMMDNLISRDVYLCFIQRLFPGLKHSDLKRFKKRFFWNIILLGLIWEKFDIIIWMKRHLEREENAVLPADSEVRYQHCHCHSLCTIWLLYTVTKDLHVLVLWTGHVLQVHETALEPRRSRIRSRDVQGGVSRMKRIGSAEVQSVPGQSAARVPSQPIWEPTFARGGD